MENENSQQKKKRPSLAWISITLLFSMLIIYTVYHVFSGMMGIKTTPTGYAEQSVSAVMEGVIFRDETPILSKYNGDVRYYVNDGERVSKDTVIAEVYSEKSGQELSFEIAELEERLEILRLSNDVGIVSITDIENLNKEIDRVSAKLYLALSGNDLERVSELERELLILLNKKKIYNGTVSNYDNEIAKLENELDRLYESFSGDSESLAVDEGGYFYHRCDGYEGRLDADKLSGASVSDISSYINEVKETPVKESEAIGKIVGDHKWYVVSVCDSSIASSLEAGRSYSVILFGESSTEVEMTLESVGEADGDKCAVTFSCSVMPAGFSYRRYQTFEIKISSVYGYRVPSDTLNRMIDAESGEEITGVYILNASVVYFKKVNIIAECDGYYIVEENDKSREDHKDFLSLNDLIIISGKDLYDGKVIDK